MKETVEHLPDLPIFTPKLKNSGEVNYLNDSEFRTLVEEQMLKSERGFVLDMSEIKMMRGQGFRVLLSTAREAAKKHKEFYITNLSEHDMNYMETTGFVELFNILEVDKK